MLHNKQKFIKIGIQFLEEKTCFLKLQKPQKINALYFDIMGSRVPKTSSTEY